MNRSNPIILELSTKLTYLQFTIFYTVGTVLIVCRIESKNKKAICPRCGLESDKLHQNHRHLVKDLPISGQPVYLQVNRRQFKGDNCRKSSIRTGFSWKSSSFNSSDLFVAIQVFTISSALTSMRFLCPLWVGSSNMSSMWANKSSVRFRHRFQPLSPVVASG